MKGVHVKGQVVQAPLIIGQGRVDKVVALAELVKVAPDPLGTRPEYVGAIAVDLDAGALLGKAIASDVVASFHDENRAAPLASLIREYRTKQAAACYQNIVWSSHLCLSLS
jgi:hypothetical protein